MISTDFTNNKRTTRKIYGIIGALITLIVPFFLMLDNHDHHLETDQSLCPFKMVTGFPCPGCGITKSLVYFYEGDLYKSLSYHILGPFVILFCATTIVVLITELITKKEYFTKLMFNRKLAYKLAYFLAFYHVVRLVLFVKNNSFDDILHQSIWF
ncbi:DUF2752 domain-containing protein [Flavobacterium foetidum]|uniref:DUF2752 domain-containing protein n=1 Tax=Flavobacterium foetidum TaxID=2026681 RepID=UPI001074B14F|nr:DUF2752 domain-containing protein [Flavobacterium foetidum]KAF2507477.1 DUF2752 domain-containing protein [Flavobacterium foetidum]